MAEIHSFNVIRQDCDGELGYLVWNADTASVDIPFATDTFIISNRKILSQTVAAHILQKAKQSTA